MSMPSAEDMRSWYKSWHEMLVKGFENGAVSSTMSFDHVVVCGMGGSGVVGDFLRVLLDGRVHIDVVKGSVLPKSIPRNSGMLAISYSGETLETILCTKQAIEQGIRVSAITRRNSTLHRIVEENGGAVAFVTEGYLPRTALAEMLGAALGLLGESKEEILRASSILKERIQGIDGIASELAGHLMGGLPVIAACGSYGVVAERWRSELSENAKMPAIVEVYPEAAHNAIVGWESPLSCEFRYLILRGQHGRDNVCPLVYGLLEEIYGDRGEYRVLDLSEVTGVSFLAGLLYPALLAGLVSVEIAVRRGVNPARTVNIEKYKLNVISKLKHKII
ncbi:MAG: hypothetical protein F7B95_03230 [Desulfurococcales archaeon]|nr:hypothetical protein [Desulfurococcales archaeon]